MPSERDSVLHSWRVPGNPGGPPGVCGRDAFLVFAPPDRLLTQNFPA